MVRGSLIYKVIFEQNVGRSEGVSHADISGTIILGRRIARDNDLGGSIQTSKNKKEARVWLQQSEN